MSLHGGDFMFEHFTYMVELLFFIEERHIESADIKRQNLADKLVASFCR